MPVMTEPVETPSPVYLTRQEVADHFGVSPEEVTLRPDGSIHGEPTWLQSRIESLSSPAEPLSIW
jgi:hypothetical protein